MTPTEFKRSVHDTYRKSIAASNTWVSYSDNISRIFNDVSIYGTDGGRDFIESNIGDIYRHITQAAKSRQAEISVRPYRCGNAALLGMVDALSEITTMEVSLSEKSINIVWAKNVVDLV